MDTGDDPYTVTTTQLSLDVVRTVSELDGARMRDVVEKLGVAKSTAHKHLTTLQENGYLTKSGNVYHLGLKFLHFGELARERWPGFFHINNAVTELTERTEEECDFVAPDRGRIITIAESYHKWVKYRNGDGDDVSNEYQARSGSYYHMHATASGLAILATYPRDRVESVIERWGLPARTEHTITSRDRLYEKLAQIRERGYAVDNEGYTEGMRSIGTAIDGPDGDVIGALSVSGPVYRIDSSVLEREIPNALLEVADELEHQLASSNADER